MDTQEFWVTPAFRPVFRMIIRHLMPGRCYWCKRMPIHETRNIHLGSVMRTCKTWNHWCREFRVFLAYCVHDFDICWNPFECVRSRVPMAPSMRMLYLKRNFLQKVRSTPESTQVEYAEEQ